MTSNIRKGGGTVKRKLKKIRIGRKSIILAAVSLILVCMTAVGATASWIEEVSQVEFSNTDGQSTPLYIGDELLKSDASVKQMSSESTAYINLKDYFYESGGMHLSPCYGDGENFYFPVQSHTADAQTTPERFRVGTKDDANVNYLSATFRISSPQANTVYWLQEPNAGHIITFKDSAGEDPAEESDLKDLWQYLRLSITIDGATTVYAYNDDGKYNTVSGSALVSPAPTGRAINKYIHYDEDYTDTDPVDKYKTGINLTKQNQGAGSNLNGNTLFTVNKGATKEVTVKLWLEYNNNGIMDVSVSNINLSICSSWAKKRRIYVHDSTLRQTTYSSDKWLSNENALLYFALKDDLSKRWQLKKVSGTDFYYADLDSSTADIDDVAAVYNNTDVILFRTSSAGLDSNSNDTTAYTSNGSTVYYWDKWTTAFPDTFHSEVFTVFSTDYGTWNEGDVHSIYFINFVFDIQSNSDHSGNEDYKIPWDYMWDSNSVHGSGINDKVVKNANWPGLVMTTKLHSDIFNNGTYTFNIPTYAFHFNSDYDEIVFSDGHLETGKNNEYQTQDLDLTSDKLGKTFDMTTLSWFNTAPGDSDWKDIIPSFSGSNTYLKGNFSTDNRWCRTRFAYGGTPMGENNDILNNTTSTNMMCRIYAKNAGNNEFVVYYNGTEYKAKDENVELYAGNTITLKPTGTNEDGKIYRNNVFAKNIKAKKIYRFYLSVHSGYINITMREDSE